MIRNRAKATPFLAGDATSDLILAASASELYQEEFRISTLIRMGKLTGYLMKQAMRKVFSHSSMIIMASSMLLLKNKL